MRILHKLLLLALVPMSLTILAIIAIDWQVSVAIFSRQAQQSVNRELEYHTERIDAFFHDKIHQLECLAASPVVDNGRIPEILKYLDQEQKRLSPWVEFLYYNDAEGTVHEVSGRTFSVRDRYYFPEIARGERVITKAIASRATGKPIVLMLVPIFNDHGNRTGAIGGTILIEDLLQMVLGIKVGKAGFAILVDENDYVVSRILPPQVPDEVARFERLDTTAANSGLRTVLQQKQSVPRGAVQLTYKNTDYRVYCKPLDLMKWRLALAYPESEILAASRQMRNWSLSVLALASGVVVLVTYGVNRILLGPVMSLISAQRRFGEGDRAVRAPVRARDEIGRLAASFNEMADQLTAELVHRQQTEIALRESEEKYRTLYETMDQGVVYMDSETRIISANPAAQRILGLTQEELQGRTTFDPRWQAVREDGTAFPGDEHPVSVALHTGKHVRNMVMGIICPARGETRWIVVNAVPQFCRGQNTPSQVYATFMDITEQKLAADALQESEDRFRTLIEQAPEAIVVFDVDGRQFVHANRNAERLFGCDHESLLRLGLPPFEAPDRPGESVSEDRLREYNARALNGEEVVFEQSIRTSQGNDIDCEVRLVRLPSACRRLLRASYIDISERKRAEAELSRHRDHLEELVADRTAALAAANRVLAKRTEQLRALAHQLTEAELRERRRIAYVLHENLQQYLVAAKYGIERLHDTDRSGAMGSVLASMDQAIQISRSLTIELRPPVLYELGLIPALERLARQVEEQYDLHVDFEADCGVEPASDSHRILMFEAVRELLLNVTKHAQVDTAEVRVRKLDEQVQISVADQGVGFDMTEASSVGFGLFGIRERIELLGGRVEVRSALTHGTCVTLTLPLE